MTMVFTPNRPEHLGNALLLRLCRDCHEVVYVVAQCLQDECCALDAHHVAHAIGSWLCERCVQTHEIWHELKGQKRAIDWIHTWPKM